MAAVVYPGSFDPLTNGHVDIVQRALGLFDRITVAVSRSTAKKTWLSFEKRLTLCQAAFSQSLGVTIDAYDGLLVDYLAQTQATIILRGLRNSSDFNFESQLAATNRHLSHHCETVFMLASESTAHISSTLVREIASMGGEVSLFVPSAVAEQLQ